MTPIYPFPTGTDIWSKEGKGDKLSGRLARSVRNQTMLWYQIWYDDRRRQFHPGIWTPIAEGLDEGHSGPPQES